MPFTFRVVFTGIQALVAHGRAGPHAIRALLAGGGQNCPLALFQGTW